MSKLKVHVSLVLGTGSASAMVSDHTFQSRKEWLEADSGNNEMAYTAIPAPAEEHDNAAEAILQLALASPEIAASLDELFTQVFEKGRELGVAEGTGKFRPVAPSGYTLKVLPWNYRDDSSGEVVEGEHCIAWPEEKEELFRPDQFEGMFPNLPLWVLQHPLPEGVLVWSPLEFDWI